MQNPDLSHTTKLSDRLIPGGYYDGFLEACFIGYQGTREDANRRLLTIMTQVGDPFRNTTIAFDLFKTYGKGVIPIRDNVIGFIRKMSGLDLTEEWNSIRKNFYIKKLEECLKNDYYNGFNEVLKAMNDEGISLKYSGLLNRTKSGIVSAFKNYKESD